MNTSRSEELFARAQQAIPGGVNSPVRAFRGVGGTPRFICHGDGATLTDVDGNTYIDYICSWGPLLLGHRPPAVIESLWDVLNVGTSFGAPTEREIEMAELIREAVPSMEMVRLVNSGTEATMSALRVARGYTGRDLTVKFEGCYHGHVDSLLVKAGSGMATLAISDTVGVPQAFAQTTIVLPFNDLEAVDAAFRERGDQIACIIVEPVAGNMGCIPPQPGFLEGLRRIADRYGTLLIFDEVMTGFRLAWGGAQARFAVTPHLTTLGKVIGGGLPIAAYGGRKDVMEKVAPSGPIYQAGTLSGNPLAVSAGLAMLKFLKAHPEVYSTLEERTGDVCSAEMPGVTVNRVGSMFTLFMTDSPVTNWDTARRCDTEKFKRLFHFMLENGVYLPPSQFEAAFVSYAHSEQDIRHTAECVREFCAHG